MLGAPRASAEESPSSPISAPPHGHHHRHHHKRRYRKSKNQQCASVQFPETDPVSESPWVEPENVNIESLLPSHTIPIKRIPSPENSPKSVNSATEHKFARIVPECSTPDKICDVSPLENLLAVAELELKQHMQSGHWNSDPEGHQSANVKDTSEPLDNSVDEIDEILKSKSEDIESDQEHKEQESNYNDDDEMSMNDILSRLEQSLESPQGFGSENTFDDEMPESDCKFEKGYSHSEEEGKPDNSQNISTPQESNQCEQDIKEEYTDNGLTEYPDIYSNENKFSEMLEAVKCLEPHDIKEDCSPEESLIAENSISELKTDVTIETEIDSKDNLNNNDKNDTDADKMDKSLLDEMSNVDDKNEDIDNSTCHQSELEKVTSHITTEDQKSQDIAQVESLEPFFEAESSNVQEELLEAQEDELVEEETAICLDLSVKNKPNFTIDISKEPSVGGDKNDDGPTDLSIRKQEPSPKVQPPRPTSQNSEAIQSPQPSGIPAVPASPDIVSTSTSISKPRSVFLESLLANSMIKTITSGADTSLGKSKEPLDLGQNRKSASPTVTCSEEVLTPSSDVEPPLKKLKPDDITLKNLLIKDIDMLEQNPKKPPSKENIVLPDTPRLLSLLKESSDTKDPLAEYKQLLTQIDIPNPLMVPKDVFPDLLKHPRREILKILSGHSNKNVALDDILVVYKDKLLGALEGSNNSTILKGGIKYSECSKLPSKPTTNKTSGQNNNFNEKTNSVNTSTKRKNAEMSNKTAAPSPDNKNSSANDTDPGAEGIFNPLFWAGCPNPFESISNYSNQNEFIQALYAASSLPYLPSQLGDLHPGLQMMLGNNMNAPLGFPPIPPMNFNNPFELSMWQEAMMQASILKNKNPYENAMLNQQNIRNSVQKKTHHSQNHVSKYNPRLSNGHIKNTSSTQQMQQQTMMHPALNQASLTKQTGWQNPYLGLNNLPQGNNNLSLDTTQYNPFSHKNNLSPTNKHNQQLSPSVSQKKNKEANIFSQYNEQEKRLHQQIMQEHQKMQQIQQQKLLRQHQHQQLLQQQQQISRQRSETKQMPTTMGKRTNPLNAFDFSKEHLQDKPSLDVYKQHSNLPVPIDLSGAQNLHSKSKSGISGHGNSTGLVSSSRSVMEDIPEVGSTTGGNEDMQDSHAQLWHPLFGNQSKGYNALNLPSLAAIGK